MDLLTLPVLFLPLHPKNKYLDFQKMEQGWTWQGFRFSLPPISASLAKSSLLVFVFTLVLSSNHKALL